jgi:hypothetical protein
MPAEEWGELALQAAMLRTTPKKDRGKPTKALENGKIA